MLRETFPEAMADRSGNVSGTVDDTARGISRIRLDRRGWGRRSIRLGSQSRHSVCSLANVFSLARLARLGETRGISRGRSPASACRSRCPGPPGRRVTPSISRATQTSPKRVNVRETAAGEAGFGGTLSPESVSRFWTVPIGGHCRKNARKDPSGPRPSAPQRLAHGLGPSDGSDVAGGRPRARHGGPGVRCRPCVPVLGDLSHG